MLLVEFKDLNALIYNQTFFDKPVKNKQEAYKNLLKYQKNNDYAKRNLLDFSHHRNYYELIGIDLSRQTNTSFSQQINFVGKLEEGDGAKMFFIAKKQQKIILNFSLDSLIVTEKCK